MGLRVAFVPGVTPSKWFRVWADRFPADPIEVVPLDIVALGAADELRVLFEPAPDARAGDPAGDTPPAPADLVIARLPVAADGVHTITLYEELPVVVVPKEHEIAVLDEITLDELTETVGERMHAVAATPTGGPDAVELVAAGVGAVLLPKSLARLWARKDVVAVPVTGAPTTTVALLWRNDLADDRAALVEEFIGVVRGRTANSSRLAGAGAEPPVKQKPTAKAKARAAEARQTEARAKASRKKPSAPGRTRPRRAR